MKETQRGVTYRLFTDNDYQPLAQIVANQWFDYIENEKDRLNCGLAELDVHLPYSTRAIVADYNGKIMGASLARWGECSRTKERLSHMERIVKSNRPHIDIAKELALIADENNLMRRVAKNRGTEGVASLELLIVSPDAQGLGIGGALMKNNLNWLKDQGATHYRLATDDDCDWAFYEHKGLTRCDKMDISDNPAVNTEEPFHIYVYEGKL